MVSIKASQGTTIYVSKYFYFLNITSNCGNSSVQNQINHHTVHHGFHIDINSSCIYLNYHYA